MNTNDTSLKVPLLNVTKTNLNDNATGGTDQGRKKVVLEKGYSLMDWIRYSKSTPNIAGNNGVLRKITYEELAQHDKPDDCWMAIFDKVYNCTPYLKFHPGGVDELLKGAGKNATQLFNDVHPWVNFQNMMEKCLIGSLVGSPLNNVKNSLPKPVESIPLSTEALRKIEENQTPSIDSYQTNDTIYIIIYTKSKHVTSDHVIVENIKSTTDENKSNLFIYVYVRDKVFKFSSELNTATKSNYSVNVSREGKIELKIPKQNTNKISTKIHFVSEKILNAQAGVNYRVCELHSKVAVSHDTFVYVFNLPTSTRMCVPLGYHVFLKFLDDELTIKPYTVIDNSLFEQNLNQKDGKQVCLMIKHYDDGAFTSKLKDLPIGAKLEMSNFTGSFNYETLFNCNELVLICAGSGFTPMIRLLIHAIRIESIKNVILLFFNKTTKDILWHDELNKFQAQYSDKIQITYVLSQPEPEWTGETGRISHDLLNNHVVKLVKKPLFCVCGPKQFTQLATDYMCQSGYTMEAIHLFLN